MTERARKVLSWPIEVARAYKTWAIVLSLIACVATGTYAYAQNEHARDDRIKALESSDGARNKRLDEWMASQEKINREMLDNSKKSLELMQQNQQQLQYVRGTVDALFKMSNKRR